MKKIVPVIVKFILAAFFLYNIGIFSLISYMKNMPAQKDPPHKADNGQGDRQYLNEKLSRAQALGKNYTPAHYFADLTEIKLKEKKNDFDYTAVININFSINQLYAIFNENVINHRVHDSEKDYEKFMQGFTAAQKKCVEATDPDQAKRDAEFQAETNRPGYWSHVFLSILAWLKRFYLKNFLLALILLWTWWYQEKNKININNPLSFIICLIFYPVFIGWVWRENFRLGLRHFAMQMEFKRRQIDIFAMISKDEMADIRRFAQSDWKISKYREYLNNRGLIRRQALVPIAAITFLFLIIPKAPSFGANYSSPDTVKYHLEMQAPPGLNGERLEHHDDQTAMPAIVFFDQFIIHFVLVWRIILPPAPGRQAGFKTNPDPVPLTY
jgi:hypothetical protein